MAIRTALARTRWITLAAIAVAIWTIVVWFEVFTAIDWAAVEYVGRVGSSGVVGLIVMASLVALLVSLVGELGEEEPSPDPWPPE